MADSLILAIDTHSIEVRPVEGFKPESIPADTTVLVTYRQTFRDEWAGLEESVPTVFTVGDAMSPRNLLTAIREGHLSARSLEDRTIEKLWNNM